jgi:EAL domain-containing protein (putative c-di-GMP-specific phosphodiesterase class I)
MLPINILKIDKSFIDKINKEESMNQILTYIINLAHQLGAEVVAEGVEHEEQLRFLKEIGCDYIQGFLLSKPLKEDHVPKQLQLYQNKMELL